jgi:hypothetical protein
MKKILFSLVLLLLLSGILFSANNIPANNSNIQYYGRWDFSNPLAPTHSWPGVYVYAEFEGTSIGITTDDNFSYYNIFIDDSLYRVWKGTTSGVASYTLASGLADAHHKILITLRSETNWTKFSFNGFILDNGKNLLPPPNEPERKIEFIGDSFTVGSADEWTQTTAVPNDSYTNTYKSYGPVIARYYSAQYHVSARGGFGLVLDYQGGYNNNLPSQFDRTLLFTPTPKWNFANWIPNLVVVCLGLNDYNGWGGYSGPVDSANAGIFRQRYHEFISTIMDAYPGVKILAVAANGLQWIKDNVSQVVAEENSWGHANIYYASFPYYNGGYVSDHPSVATHQKIADTLIAVMNTMNPWMPYVDVTPPRITKIPSSPVTVYETSYVLNVQTDSYDTLRYSTTDKSFSEMENVFTTTGTRSHSVTLSLQQGLDNTFYIKGKDLYGNTMSTSAVVHFLVDTTKHALRWTLLAYDDSQWKKGLAPFGSINDADTVTQIGSVTTAYFRRKITLDSLENRTALKINVKGREGAIVYVNGQELGRIKMPSGSDVPYTTFAIDTVVFNQKVPLVGSANQRFNNGENIIAVEVHAGNGKKVGVAFDIILADASGNIYSPAGSEWSYYDLGNMPGDQTVAKPTDVALGTGTMLPKKMILLANYPNPFNPVTTIRYELPAMSHVSMKIYDLLGREITTLVNEVKSAGTYNVQFNAGNLSSGMYFCRIQADRSFAVSKLMLVK